MSHEIVLSKLKRNGIKGKYIANQNELILGGGSRDPGLLITGIIFLGITVLTLVLTGAGIMPYLGRITIYIIGISIFAGVTMLGIYEKNETPMLVKKVADNPNWSWQNASAMTARESRKLSLNDSLTIRTRRGEEEEEDSEEGGKTNRNRTVFSIEESDAGMRGVLEKSLALLSTRALPMQLYHNLHWYASDPSFLKHFLPRLKRECDKVYMPVEEVCQENDDHMINHWLGTGMMEPFHSAEAAGKRLSE